MAVATQAPRTERATRACPASRAAAMAVSISWEARRMSARDRSSSAVVLSAYTQLWSTATKRCKMPSMRPISSTTAASPTSSEARARLALSWA